MRILAVSSGGGHWIELLRLRPALDGHDVDFVTVQRSYSADVTGSGFHVVRDATQWDLVGLALLALQMLVLVIRIRPDTVVSTGAAPGYFAIRFGKLLRARTIWIDSLANVDEVSRAGRLARRYTDLWLTQWPNLATEDGPEYAGQIL